MQLKFLHSVARKLGKTMMIAVMAMCMVSVVKAQTYSGGFGLRAGTSHDVLGIRITNLTENTTYHYTMQTLGENDTVLDTKEGSFTTEGTTGIKEVSPDLQANPIGYFTILGQRLPQEPAKGLYIILYDNGKAVKVMR